MMLTSPYSSMSEFWSGVAVSSSFGALDSAVLIALAVFAPGLKTLRRRCASSRITRSHGTTRQLGGLARRELIRAHDHRGIVSGQIERIGDPRLRLRR